ncbi:prepilin-type N-terminal cleavage/methylation domain-containing protein [Celerinatantimonas yamalensis]|uniref:Prepilin-type N-terminal cleavage/methylation domain-containing protein n=1 Tax=Celerinatantimonas yamalensis TaxID=559956 RepID=A0ABW9GAA5_9GAMM
MKQHGFSLIEVLVASLLLGLSLVGQFGAEQRSIALERDANAHYQAMVLVQAVLALAQADRRIWLKQSPWNWQFNSQSTQQLGTVAMIDDDLSSIAELVAEQHQNGWQALSSLMINVSLSAAQRLLVVVRWQSFTCTSADEVCPQRQIRRQTLLLP